jgi:hypothetical protein
LCQCVGRVCESLNRSGRVGRCVCRSRKVSSKKERDRTEHSFTSSVKPSQSSHLYTEESKEQNNRTLQCRWVDRTLLQLQDTQSIITPVEQVGLQGTRTGQGRIEQIKTDRAGQEAQYRVTGKDEGHVFWLLG